MPTTNVVTGTSARVVSVRSESAGNIQTVLITKPAIIRASAEATKLTATRDTQDIARMDMFV